jgi:hypothetical protein
MGGMILAFHEITHAIEFLGLLSEDSRSGASLLVADDLQLIAVGSLPLTRHRIADNGGKVPLASALARRAGKASTGG